MKTIVWDVDDVLNDLMHRWLEDYKAHNPLLSSLKYKHLVKNPPHDILDISLDDYLISLDQFRLDNKKANLVPNQQILSWFHQFGKDFRHLALTARPKDTVSILSQWVFEHFGNWIRTVSFIPSSRKGRDLITYDKSKADFLIWLGKADYFIDDSPENIQLASSMGINSLLFPQPWNGFLIPVEEILEKLEP